MFKMIKRLGQFLVKLYNIEARKLDAKARVEAKLSRELAERARQLSACSIEHVEEAAKVASQAQQLAKFFD